MMDTPLTLFWKKVGVVGETLNRTGDYKSVSPVLREIVEIVQSNPKLSDQFEAAFIEILENTLKHSPLVVEYAMFTLRFPKIRSYVEARLNREKLKGVDMHARHVLEAYSENWILASMFK
jgi:hypothetical protein